LIAIASLLLIIGILAFFSRQNPHRNWLAPKINTFKNNIFHGSTALSVLPSVSNHSTSPMTQPSSLPKNEIVQPPLGSLQNSPLKITEFYFSAGADPSQIRTDTVFHRGDLIFTFFKLAGFQKDNSNKISLFEDVSIKNPQGKLILNETEVIHLNQTVEKIRGEKGTSVTLTIFRDGDKEPQEIKIVRDVIELPTLDTEKRADGIFVIKLYNFSEHSPELFQKALIAFADSGSTKLLLDLRGNPGGYLDAAVDMASWFLPVGKIVVSEDFGGNAEPRIYRSKGYDIFNEELRMVILVDNGSASASEILAGSLNEHGVAKLVGTQTYGKGSVQELVKVTDTTSLKITVAKWLTPKGISISEKGLTPDYLIPVTKADIAKKKDPQLAKAVQLLLQQ